MSRTQAFILAGGQGERLHPLTVSRPKPAVSFGGTFRIIDFTLANCLKSGIGRVSVLTQYKHEELHRHVRQQWRDAVCLPPQPGKRYRGTADAVFCNSELVDDSSDSVLILAGDHIYQMDYRDLLRQHAETNADVTIATVEHPLDEASHFGVVEVDDHWRVTGFEEKPARPHGMRSNPSMALVSMGVYAFKKSVLLGALRDFCELGIGYDFGRDLIPVLMHFVRTYAYDFPHYWRDIGTIDAYYAASMDLARQDARLKSFANAHAPSARLHASCRVTQSVLSPGVHVEEGATVEECVLMPGVHVGKDAHLRRAIVEEGVHIPAGFRAGFDLERDRQHHVVTNAGVLVIDRNPADPQSSDGRMRLESVKASLG